MEKKLKLDFELIPDGCWYSNLRTSLKPFVWDKIRKTAYKKADGRCMICGAKVSRLEAHEVWSYDTEKGVQKLEKVIAVCSDCHSVIHINRTLLKGDGIRAENHFMKVNKCSYAEYRQAMGKANELHKERSKVGEWLLDLTELKNYGIDLKDVIYFN